MYFLNNLKALSWAGVLLLSVINLNAPCHAQESDGAATQPAEEVASQPSESAASEEDAPKLLEMPHNIQVHDPVIAKEGDTYYVFCTGGFRRENCIPIFTSTDMKDWQPAGHVFDKLPEWVDDEVPRAQNCWAPDISYFNGKYHLYYSLSSFGVNHSAIGLVTNKTLDPESPDYEWVDEGVVVRSTPDETDFNAIDPNIVIEDEENIWMSWGSFWGGIMMRKINPETGKFDETHPKMYNIAARPRENEHVTPPIEGAIEAPFIVKHGDYWYQFVSHDFCCRGPESDYKVVIGRAKEVTGPYYDKDGVDLAEDGGSIILQTTNDNWYGAGHPAVYSEDGTDYMLFHAYPAEARGSWLRISTIKWEDGWPEVAELP